jgi:hypothetical protein
MLLKIDENETTGGGKGVFGEEWQFYLFIILERVKYIISHIMKGYVYFMCVSTSQ